MFLYADFSSFDRLMHAWDKVRRNNGAAGPDGVTIPRFARMAHHSLGELSKCLKVGTYQCIRPRKVAIPKKDGSLRQLAIFTIEDRIVHTAIAQSIAPLLEAEMSEDSFGYRPGRSVQMAIDRVSALYRSGYRWVVDADIDDYFDNVDHKRLLEVLRRYKIEGAALDLIQHILDVCEPDGIGLPQGSPLSPLLANIFLDDMDDAISSHGVRLVRYADDFLILCKNVETADSNLAKVSALLEKFGLGIHPDKTKVVPFEEGFHFLGHLFLKSLVIKQLDEEDEKWVTLDTPIKTQNNADEQNTEIDDCGFDLTPARRELSSRLRCLYVMEKGRKVCVRNKSIVVRNIENDQEVVSMTPGWADRIEVSGGAEITNKAIRLAAKDGTMISFVDGWGQSLAETIPAQTMYGKLHLEQARHVLDHEKRLELACLIVQGRIANQRALLNRLNRRRKDEDVKDGLKKIGRIIRKLKIAETPIQAMGYEGEAAKIYWSCVKVLLDEAWGFKSRKRKPPTDPVNGMISYVSAMLFRDIHCLVVRHGLHAGYGFLHESNDRNFALCSDFIEEFRAPLVEGLAIYLVNNSIMKQEYFSKTADGACLMHPDGRSQLIIQYEKWLDREIVIPVTKEKTKWRGLIDFQVMRLKEHILGGETYKPYLMDY